MAFEAWGKDLEEVFRAAGDATINVMIEDLDSIINRESRSLALRHEELDLLLFDFLQRLVYHKDADYLLLRPAELEIRQEGGEWILTGTVKGEELDPARHRQIVDVKAVTLHGFKLEETEEGWRARVILDI